MHTVIIHEAKTHLSRLVERAAQGEEIIIAKAGKPMAKLVPYREDTGPRQPGYWEGKVKIHDDFDTLPDDIEAALNPAADCPP
ncbi:MAG TPA: type II toxin-antitoxin system Phd/YefM family antitoxin [Candidatus Hydrogenedentes bacterium]|nr:type II toxin-antitoxin system Phd/YefM family antitoxin [Candidatus Hydrogenedentota bacterium]HPG66697.1 type II toxin-antitoxin system Phd/YefM family antitoxin [Candidatus Hydrogenedentota bacterium]